MARSGKIGVVLVAMVGLVAVQASCQTVARSSDGRHVWKEQLADAHRLAEEGKTYVLVIGPREGEASGSGSVHVFHNRLDPICYTYTVPGQWLAGAADNTYRSKDGKAVAGVRFLRPADLQTIDGATLLERSRKFLTREYEKGLRRTLPSAGLVPFESQRPGTWKWMATTATEGEKPLLGVTNLLVDLKPEAVVQVAVSGTKDNDDLARRIVESLQTTSDAECYWPLLERTAKDASRKQ
jgi:hypothetical protein